MVHGSRSGEPRLYLLHTLHGLGTAPSSMSITTTRKIVSIVSFPGIVQA
jgi:hypothetical protein